MLFFILFTLLNLKAYANENPDIIIGGSIYKEKETDKNAEYVRGAICYLNKIIDSESGIVPKATFYDNRNKPSRDVSNTRRLVFSEKASILMGYSNIEGALKSIDEVKSKDIIMAFPFVSLSKEDMKKYSEDIFFIRPSIEDDLDSLADFVKGDESKIVILYEESKEWEKEYLEKKLKNKVDSFSYVQEPLKMNRALLDMKKLNPDKIIILGESNGSINFIKRIYFTNLKNSTILLPFYLTNSEIKKEIKRYEIKAYASQIFPSLDSDREIVKEYIKCSKKYEPNFEVGESGLEGYLTASILYEIILNGDVKDKKKMIETFKKIDMSEVIKPRVEEY